MFSYFAILSKSQKSFSAVDLLIAKINEQLPDYKIDFKSEYFCLMSTKTEDSLLKKYFIDGNGGAVLGTIFRRTANCIGESVPTNIEKSESRITIETNGRHLIENYWGNYIAFIFNETTGESTVVRDPSGTIPGVYFETDDYIIFFMDIIDLLKINRKVLHFERKYFEAFVKSPILDMPISGLKEMGKILGGQALKLRKGSVSKEIYWHPRQFCDNLAYTDPAIAMRDLRNVVEGCIHAWASQFDRILLRLSGGFDSTITLACLKSAPTKPEIICENVYLPNPGEDEREFARSAAEFFGVKLIERYNDPAAVDLRNLSNFYLHPDPMPCFGNCAAGDTERKLAEAEGLEVVMTGEGGDTVFHETGQGTAADYAQRHGLGLRLIREAMICAQVRNESFAKILTDAVYARFMRPAFSWENMVAQYPNEMMPPDLYLRADLDRIHSWLIAPLRDVPAAKAEQVTPATFAYTPRIPTRPEWYMPIVNPLLSQPLREVTARIPTYMFSHGGMRRGLARLAFADSAPGKNIFRQSKGGVSTFVDGVIATNLDFLRKYYKDCFLVDLGIWDKAQLNKALAGDLSQGHNIRMHTLVGLGMELWLKKMSAAGCRMN